MIFPLTTNLFWQNPLDPAKRIDREIADRSYRLAIGLSFERDLETIRGVLAVSQGHGKYMRLRHVVPKCVEVPRVVSEAIRRIIEVPEPGFFDLAAVSLDLARCQAELVEELKSHAGKYVDRLLAVSSIDSGLWLRDEDGRSVFRSLGDPVVLAELCGITVIDSFPTRDLAAGGDGCGLGALPAWILFGDRSTTVARRDRLVFSIADSSDSYFLPASDGLDAELPEVQLATGPGINLLRAIMQNAQRPFSADQIVRLSVDGKMNAELLKAMESELKRRNESESESLPVASLGNRVGGSTAHCLADVIRTAIVFIVDTLSDRIADRGVQLENTTELFVDSPDTITGVMINQLQRRWPKLEVRRLTDYSMADGYFNATVASILGMFCIDQMPANIPGITGAGSQKILGRITPGTPANWRQLLREMADFQPPAMRLRDAV